jgi:single-strand DNA-binding protein
MLKGFVGKDPVVRFLPSGDSVMNFSIATVIHNNTEWHRIVCYTKVADSVSKAELRSGDFVFVEAEIRSREMKTEGGAGKPKKLMELVAAEVHLLSRKDVTKNDETKIVEKGVVLEDKNSESMNNDYNSGSGLSYL